MNFDVRVGDCRTLMREMPESSVDSIVTDPPYHLTSIVKRFGSETAAPAKSNGATGVYGRASKGFMGQTWDGGDVAFDPETWAEVLRVLKPGGHLLAFSGSRTYHRMVCAIEDAGFEIRDQIMWVYGSGFPKSLDVSKAIDKAVGAEREYVGEGPYAGRKPRPYKGGTSLNISVNDPRQGHPITAPATNAARQWQGWGTALKPAHEPIVLARKPLVGTVADNVLQFGTGALNIDQCRVGHWTEFDLRNMAVSSRGDQKGVVSFGLKGSDQALDAHPNGRWPANLIHDGSDEVEAAFAAFGTKTSGALSPQHNVKESTGWSGGSRADRVKREFGGNTGSASRFFYCAKASKADRDDGLDGERSTHPTVKPTDLMRYLCRLVTPPGGTVLDPFCGSGSTGRGAVLEGFSFIGCELSPEYATIAEKRIAAVSPEPPERRPDPGDPLPLFSWLEASQ
jgi:DNA modification methylase